MINNLKGTSKKILQVLLGINVILLIISFFYISGGFVKTSIIINIVLLISFFTIDKYTPYFEMMMQVKNIGLVSRGLNNVLGKLNG